MKKWPIFDGCDYLLKATKNTGITVLHFLQNISDNS